ncbi:hypothetical protein AVEN_219039-1, partial [Araneus ventricosus]
ESTKSTAKNVLETNKMQSAERKKLIQQFQNQMYAVINQSETEMEKLKDAEEKLQKALVQQQKHQQQIRIAHSQRLKVLKDLSEEFCKGMTELEESHVEQYSAVHNELRKEMAILQKKILMDIQQQEMMNIQLHSAILIIMTKFDVFFLLEKEISKIEEPLQKNKIGVLLIENAMGIVVKVL